MGVNAMKTLASLSAGSAASCEKAEHTFKESAKDALRCEFYSVCERTTRRRPSANS